MQPIDIKVFLLLYIDMPSNRTLFFKYVLTFKNDHALIPMKNIKVRLSSDTCISFKTS